MSWNSNALADRITDAVFALDTAFRFTYVNDRTELLFERPRSDLLGEVIWDVFPETLETHFSSGLHRALDEEVAVSFEVRYGPQETWYEVRVYPGIDGISVFIHEITDRKEREQTRAYHATVIEAISDAVFVLDRTNRIAAVNEATATHLGAGDVVGEHVEQFTQRASIPDEHSLEIGRAIDEVHVGRAEQRRLEVPYTDAAGDDRTGELRLVPVADENATVAGILRDVTDRHEHERLVESLHQLTRWLVTSDDPEEICSIAVHGGSELLNLSMSGVWLYDETHGYLDPVAATGQAYDVFGGLPRFHTGEGLVWDVFELGDVAVYEELQAMEGVYNSETELRSEIIAPIGTHGVLMTGSFESHRFDETDVELIETLVENIRAALDRAEQDRLLRERTEQLERQTERLQAVSDVLSNDLTQQLETITETLESPANDGWEFPLATDSVETTIDRAEQLVDDVREFARNATAPGSRRAIDLEAAINAAVTYSRLEPAAVEIETPATLRADPDRFGRLLEAIFNDAAARADGAVTIRVGVVAIDDPTDRGFYVFDDAEELGPIEQPDTAAGGSPDRPFEPTAVELSENGLGLALVRAIAEAHGWSVSLTRADGGRTIELRDVTTLEVPSSATVTDGPD